MAVKYAIGLKTGFSLLFFSEHTVMIKAVTALRMRKKLRISVILIRKDYKGDFVTCQSLFIMEKKRDCNTY